LFFYSSTDLKVMPDMSGVAMQLFGYTAMVANTVPATEGTPGVGQTVTQVPAVLNLANYVDYISYSNKVKLTAISDTVAEGSALLAFRGAYSVDTVIQNAYIAAANATPADYIKVADGFYMTASLSRQAVWKLRAFDVKPKANGLFFGIIHSLNAYDLVNDATAAGFTDLQKYTESLAPDNPALAGIRGARVGNVGGCEFFESNAVTVTPGYAGSPPKNGYNVYVIGHQASISSSLGKTNLSQKNFTVVTRNFPIGSNSLDPGGLIAAASIYNFFFGCIIAPQTVVGTDKFRIIQVESSIG
jgi:N4-gp56 family major capsid protein